MYDDLLERRVKLLRWGERLSNQEGYVLLDDATARAAGYAEAYGEQTYMKVLEEDREKLERNDNAVEIATEHRGYGLGGLIPYRLTNEGRQLLIYHPE